MQSIPAKSARDLLPCGGRNRSATKAGFQLVENSSPSAILEGAGRKSRSLLFIGAMTALLSGCSILATRPVQEMSDTSAAIRAAREVQADTLAPELFRQANEWFFRAKHEYKFKNFTLAREYSDKARLFAENAEFEAIRNGGNRTEMQMPDPMAPGLSSPPTQPIPSNPQAPYPYPTPTGTPAEPTLPTAPAPGSPPSP